MGAVVGTLCLNDCVCVHSYRQEGAGSPEAETAGRSHSYSNGSVGRLQNKGTDSHYENFFFIQ